MKNKIAVSDLFLPEKKKKKEEFNKDFEDFFAAVESVLAEESYAGLGVAKMINILSDMLVRGYGAHKLTEKICKAFFMEMQNRGMY